MKYGRYEVERELGKGAMGVVYQAHDPQIDRRVALKVLRADRVTSQDFAQRFLKEARAIGRLSHPHIVTVYDVGGDHDTVYIAMEFLEGRPLNELLLEKTLTVAEIIDIGVQVALSLDYAHGQGIVHRDIKPSNIMITPEGQVKITDFGIARIEDPSAAHLTQDGEILGTPTYMSPEQVKGQTVDGRSDLYSLGVILYEMSTGRRPFTGRNIAAIFHAITTENPEEPMAIEPFVARGGTPALSTLIMKGLSKAPESRFQTGKEMVEALQRCLKSDGYAAGPKRTADRKNPRVWVYSAVSACVLLIVAGILWVKSVRKHEAPVIVPAIEQKTQTESKPPASTTPEAKEKIVQTAEQPVTVLSSALAVNSNPKDAQVYLDGVLKGKTPIKVDLPVGKYEVRVSLPDYYEWEAQVQIKDPGELPLNVRLIPMK